MTKHSAGCLCGAQRFSLSEDPARTMICHCKFCQKTTGSAFMIDAVFPKTALTVEAGTAATYGHQSEGSGKQVTINFCGTCGTHLYLTFEAMPNVVGVFAGALDDPNVVKITPETTRVIFASSARQGSLFPAEMQVFEEGQYGADGVQRVGLVHDHPMVAGHHT